MSWDQYMQDVLVLACGAFGAVVRVATANSLSRRQIVLQLVAGALMAVCVAPAVVELWLTASSPAVQRLVSFVVGATGPLLVELSLRVLERRGERLIERAAKGAVDRIVGGGD